LPIGTSSIGTSASSSQIPSLRSRVNGHAADCARAVFDGGPNDTTRSACGSFDSAHGNWLDPVAVSLALTRRREVA